MSSGAGLLVLFWRFLARFGAGCAFGAICALCLLDAKPAQSVPESRSAPESIGVRTPAPESKAPKLDSAPLIQASTNKNIFDDIRRRLDSSIQNVATKSKIAESKNAESAAQINTAQISVWQIGATAESSAQVNAAQAASTQATLAQATPDFILDSSADSSAPLLDPPPPEPIRDPRIPRNTKSRYIQLTNNQPVYILPAYYSFSTPYSTRDIPVEMKFQVSFRVVFLERLVCKYCGFDFAYTQTHWFQIYNTKDSKPMRDINFSPSINFNYDRQIPLFGGYITWLRFGYLHISNGERENNLDVGLADRRNNGLSPQDAGWFSRSKSLDRFVVQADWQRGRFGLSLRAWVPLTQYILSDKGDNTNIASYIGYGDIMLSYVYKRHRFELYLNNIFNNYFSADFWDWKGRAELGYTYGLSKRVGVYFQLVHGYGDSLYEFNYFVTRAGAGLRLNF